MVTVMKAGGSSVADRDKIAEIIEQARGFDGPVVLTVSAQGKTTKRIENAIAGAKKGERVPPPDEIFQEFERTGVRTSKVAAGIRDAAYGGIHALENRTGTELDDPSYIAVLHLCGERLSAIAVHDIARQCGVDASLIDFVSDDFPLVVKGYHLGATIDTAESRRKARQLMQANRSRLLVLPGYGGLDKSTKGMKTLGRGGSDTAAFGYLYAVMGNRLYILTDVPGILTAAVDDGKTVPVLDVEEAKDAASLGAKLPGRRSLKPLEIAYAEGMNPYILITSSQNLAGPGTRIVKETDEKVPVKLVAGRNVVVYQVSGGIKGLQGVFDGSGVDWSGAFTDGHARLVVSEETAGYARRLLDGYMQKRRNGQQHNGIEVTEERNLAYAGVVGSGMYGRPDVTGKASGALGSRGINIRYNTDPGPASLGFVVGGNDLKPAIEVLHREFLSSR